MQKKPQNISKMASSTILDFIFIVLLKLSAAVATQNLTNLFTSVLVFGDSTVDTGNNNYITTPFKADHLPYGQDYPGRIPTGRFSNGKLVPIGLKDSVPPYLHPNLTDFDIRTGVNFASAGSGYDDVTSQISQVIPVTKQLVYFKEYIKRLKNLVGVKEAKRIVKGALVSINAGTNDFTINYYDLRTRSADFAISDYQDFVLKKLENFINELYDLGCRTMVVSGLPPMGCLPFQMATRFTGDCLEEQNLGAQIYNKKLVTLLGHYQSSLNGSLIMYADIYTPLVNMIQNPQKHGFTETKVGCCGFGLLEAGPLCTSLTPLCTNPSNHVFFDSIHPTEAAYRYVTKRLLRSLIGRLKALKVSK